MRIRYPRTKKEVRQALGALGFYRAYIEGYAGLCKVLTDMTGKNKPNKLTWGTQEQKCFDELKLKVCSAPVLITPQYGKPFVLYTDASLIAVGCCLAQNNDENEEHPIAYGSKKLSATHSAWSTIEREAYAVIWALGKYHDITFGAKITVLSDHNPLKYITESTSKSAKLTRWCLALQEYDLILQYKKGIHNNLADGLSRLVND